MPQEITTLPALKSHPKQSHFDVWLRDESKRATVFASTAAQARKWAAKKWAVSQQLLTVGSRPDLNRLDPMVEARRACLTLAALVYDPECAVLLLGQQNKPSINALIEEFDRLDRAEQRRLATARAQGKHGKDGGRPKKL